ncbi:hypothetical protein DFP72DRAFT_1123544, partial [Ephemerocybe angulata]
EKRKDFQLKKSDLPADLGGLKDAMIFHIRLLWHLLDAKAIPGDPPQTNLELFLDQFKSKAAVFARRGSSHLLVSVKKITGASRLATYKSRSKIVLHARKMEENLVLYIDSNIARFGLVKWAPDFRQSPYSAYNSACRIIAIDTFRQAVVSHAYASYKPNIAYAEDMDLLIRLYDHVVHHFFYGRYTREVHNPGSVQVADEQNTVYKSRSRLAESRLNFMVENRWNPLLHALASTAATSDDERDPGDKKLDNRPVFYTRRRPERSAAANSFIRDLEFKREKNARLDRSKRWKERVRIVPSHDQEDTLFPALPEGMPIDYFDPDFYNSLEPNLRSRIAIPEVALL